jgi:hypothetical protein
LATGESFSSLPPKRGHKKGWTFLGLTKGNRIFLSFRDSEYVEKWPSRKVHEGADSFHAARRQKYEGAMAAFPARATQPTSHADHYYLPEFIPIELGSLSAAQNA